MNVATHRGMTAGEFIAWATARTDRNRHELIADAVVPMAPERVGHARGIARVWRALDDAIRGDGLGCAAHPDGIAVEIDERTVYVPDAPVRCGPPLDDEAVRIVDPIVVVEVSSPSSEARDTGAKLADYARLASIRHYLIVDPESRVVVHHRIEGESTIQTTIVRSGALMLDPPRIVVTLEAIFT